MEKIHVKTLFAIILIVIINFSLTFLQSYNVVIHTILEVICIYFALATFSQVWYTYDRANAIHHTIGFGFVVVAFFNLMHTFLYRGTHFSIPGYPDLAARFCLLASLTMAIVLLLITYNNFRIHLNKWVGIVIATIVPAAFSYLVITYPYLLPNLQENGNLNLWRIFFGSLIILMYFMALFKLKKLRLIHSVTKKYVSLAILIAIPAEIILFLTAGSSINLFPHFLRLLTYYFLFKGTYVSAVIYPYEKLENILDSFNSGLITYDDNLYVTYVNKKMETILGYKKQDLICKPVLEWAQKFQMDQTQKLIIEGDSEKDRLSIGNLQDICNINGEKIKVRTDLQKLVSGGYISLFHDAKKEQELENLQIQTQTILDSIQNFVFIVDKNNIIILCNEAFSKLVGLKVSDIVGLDLRELNKVVYFYSEEMKQKIYWDENLKSVSATMVDTKGVEKEILINSGPIINFDGEIIGAIKTGVEVTAYKMEQEKLKQQEKLAVLGQMAAGIVHEIRNPLTTLKGFAQLVNNKTSDDVVKEYACTMEKEVDSINHIVSDFLTFAKPQFPVLKEVSLNNLLESLSLLVETKSFIEGVDIQLILTPHEKMVLADEFQLRQVVLNIVKNGIEAMNHSDKRSLDIKNSVNEKTGEMQITITDNGQGMSQEDISKVGTPFYSTKSKGTGLGLSICYQIIKEHGGHIDIISKLGKGTTFIISLPYVK